MTEKELKKLLEDMSLEEKLGQMTDVAISLLLQDNQDLLTGPLANMGFLPEQKWLIGTVHGNFEVGEIIKLQEEYTARHPHHIPLLVFRDIIHGMRTIFPAPLAQGATFSPELSEECARITAKEAALSGVHGTFAPMADLVRDARWGRVVESTGEDPWLNAQFSQAMVRGFQGKDIKQPGCIAACVKHFAAYGAAVAGRDYNTAEVSLHTLRNLYMSGYEAGIGAGAEMVMTSFNTVEGIPATVNKKLLRDVLREQFGFQGVLITDYAAIQETIAHGVCADRKEAAQKALEAGVDVEMMGSCYFQELPALLEEGAVTQAQIDESVMRVLRLKNRLGLFENPCRGADAEKAKRVILSAEHREAARKTAEASFVLLKNDGLLPLSKEKNIAWIGPYVFEKHLQSSWAVSANAADTVSLAEAVERYFPKDRNSFHKGCSLYEESDIWRQFSWDHEAVALTEKENERLLREAMEAARKADLAVMALGESYLQSGEATSRTEIRIPERQMELLRRVAEVQPRLVVILFHGRPLELREISELADSILAAWFPGTEGGNALCNILTGKSVPQGKLPMSFPWSVGQVPVFYNEYSTGRPFNDRSGKEIRYLSKYIDAPNRPMYPFGFGLSYTNFEITGRRLSRHVMTEKEILEASAIITNTGNREGIETLQMYLQDVTASAVRPVKELKAVQKVALRPGEGREVRFSIKEEMLRFHTADGRWESEPGIFRVYIGNSSETEEYMEFELAKAQGAFR